MLKTEPRVTSFYQTCAVCELALSPQLLRAVFEPWKGGYRIWSFVCLHHSLNDINRAYHRKEIHRARRAAAH